MFGPSTIPGKARNRIIRVSATSGQGTRDDKQHFAVIGTRAVRWALPRMIANSENRRRTKRTSSVRSMVSWPLIIVGQNGLSNSPEITVPAPETNTERQATNPRRLNGSIPRQDYTTKNFSRQKQGALGPIQARPISCRIQSCSSDRRTKNPRLQNDSRRSYDLSEYRTFSIDSAKRFIPCFSVASFAITLFELEKSRRGPNCPFLVRQQGGSQPLTPARWNYA